jgi:hypothetical protein
LVITIVGLFGLWDLMLVQQAQQKIPSAAHDSILNQKKVDRSDSQVVVCGRGKNQSADSSNPL